jgi:hypothetical protein
MIDISPIEVNLVATNQSDRSVAQAKVDSVMLSNSRSNSKSPSSMRSHRPLRHGTESPPHSPEFEEVTRPKSSSRKSSRRPHTSSGPSSGSKSIFSSENAPDPHGKSNRDSFQPPLSATPPFPPSSFILPSKFKSRPQSGSKHDPAVGSFIGNWNRSDESSMSKSRKRGPTEMLQLGRGSSIHASERGHNSISIRPNPAVVAALPAS